MAGVAVNAPEIATIVAGVQKLVTEFPTIGGARDVGELTAMATATTHDGESFTWEVVADQWRIGDRVRVTIEKIER